MSIITGNRRELEVMERDEKDSIVLVLDPELSVDQRQGDSGLWSATVTWADSVYCTLRERTRGSIEAEGEMFARKYGKRRPRTGKMLRADAIEWARGELREFYLKLLETGGLPEHGPLAVAGKLTWGEAIAIIRQRSLHVRGKRGKCSRSQANKYERILDIVALAWPSDRLVEATSQSHVNEYHALRQGEHLEWERDSKGDIKLDSRSRKILARAPGRNGKPGRVLTPYSVVFPPALGRRNLPPVDEVTATSELKDLKTLLNRLLKETDDSGNRLLASNPLDGKDLGSFAKRALEPASVDRYRWTMRHADEAIAEMASSYPGHVYVSGMLRCILALAFHSGHRIGSICCLQVRDILLHSGDVQNALGQMRVKNGEQKPARDWAKFWTHGAIYWREQHDKEGYDRVIPINATLRDELVRYLRRRSECDIQTEWLFPRPIEPDTHLQDFDARDMLYVAERLARTAAVNAKLNADEILPTLEDRAFHGYRALWENLRDDLGWFSNKNSAYAGGWTTKGGGAQQNNYNQLKPYYIQAVVDGKSVFEVLASSTESQRAKEAIQTPAPEAGDPDIVPDVV